MPKGNDPKGLRVQGRATQGPAREPRFPAGLFFDQAGIVTDADGKPWHIDPGTKTLSPVTVEEPDDDGE